VVVYTFVGILVLAKIVKTMIGLRAKDEEEMGLDISEHGDKAYGGL